MDRKAMLNAIISHYSDGNKSKFAAKLGITPQAINSWEKRNTFDINLIYAKCEGINANWLLTGQGPMLIDSNAATHVASNIANGSNNNQTVVTTDDAFWKDLVSQLREDLRYWKDRCTSAEEHVKKLEDLKDHQDGK